MLGSIGRFLKNRSGAFAMQFALMAVPLTICTGLAIDGGRVFLARYELNSALDAAALAVGSIYSENADLNGMAHKFVNKNFHGDHKGPIALELDANEDRVVLKGHVIINTYFMPLVGRPEVTVSAESEVKRGGNNVEVALALDITESMSGSRITALKEAATDLVNAVVNDVQTPYFSKVAIVPWANNVHVGAYADQLRGTLRGQTAITGAHWRDGASKTITGAGWRVGTARDISTANWRYGSALTVSTIVKNTSGSITRIRVQTSANHGYTTGQYVRITGANGSFTGLDGNVYVVEVNSSTRFYLRNLDNTAYIAAPAGTIVNGSAGAVQRCFSDTCEVGVTTTSSHGFSTGDRINLSGVSGMTAINNSQTTTWTIGAASGSTFVLPGTAGPGSAQYDGNGTGGKASKCVTGTCEYQVTAANHGFANDDYVYISGAGTSGSGTSINNGTGSTWQIGGVTANTFLLPGVGMSYRDWDSSGTAAECFNATCRVKVTSVGHALAAGEDIQIKSIGGFTGVNNSGSDIWEVASVPASNTFYVDTWGPGLSNATVNYTANTGNVQCVEQGCLKYRFTSVAGSTVIRTASNCVTERTGAQAYTDASPATAPLGASYPGSYYLVTCEDNNAIVPLTATKKTLTDAIAGMDVTGSTAGQIGTAWGWYMVSPDWGYLWPNAENKPKAYDTKELAKVVVLMTDGEFNTAHCNGVQSKTYGYSSIPQSDRINCDPAETPFQQAAKTCANMKKKKVIVYTVGFGLDKGSEGEAFLAACATDSSHAYLAASSSELKAAFKSIATSISRLRISK